MSLALRITLLGIVAALVAGCYPYKPTYTDDYDLVATNYNKNFDFSTNKTYALPDSIAKISSNDLDPDGNGRPDFVNQTTANLILNTIRANMNANGWTETDSLSANVILLPMAFENTQVVQYYYSSWYYGWYYPGYAPGWGWGYPGYYPGYGYGTTTYKTGTLLVQMTYPDGMVNEQIPVEWIMVINGLLDSGTVPTSQNSRITKGINQAFTQSPYLK